MEPVVTSAEMQACDRFAIEKLKIPSLSLMENAGRGVVEMMLRHFGPLKGKHILIFSGKGNNGGDGFVMARHLVNLSCRVSVVLIGKSSQLKGDARVSCGSLKIMSRKFPRDLSLKFLELRSLQELDVLPEPALIVDAIFGTGFKGEVRGIYKQVIEWMNSSSAPKVSVDIPSGVDADNGTVENVAVNASLTCTMGLRKIGLTTGMGIEYAGNTQVIDIGIPRPVLNMNARSTFVVEKEDVRSSLPRRPLNAHKHSVGKILILAGSRGLTGAAAMTSVSAMRAGAGAVVLGTPSAVHQVLAKKVTEVMVTPLSDTEEGALSLGAFEDLKNHLSWADVLVLGPGISRSPETQQLVWKLVSECDLPMLIDADGLNALAERISVLKKHRSKNVILTPHEGELSRLLSVSSEEVEQDRVKTARRAAKEFNATVILKGACTVTASEDGLVIVNSTGNPGMATAGSGDVLAGLIGGLWAQGMKRGEAAYAGAFIHGFAGDLAKVKYGERSLLATDIQELLPDALLRIERSGT